MKKIISLILVALFAVSTLSLVACGGINGDSQISILWSGKGVAEVPDSLINSIERAMYIENITYLNYGAEGDATKQYNQAEETVNNGCAVLIVEPVTSIDVGKYIDLAKSKNIPLIFIGNDAVRAAVKTYNEIKGAYDKCIIVSSDNTTIPEIQGKLIADYVVENFKDLDRNGDGKISYAAYSSALTAEEANKLLTKGEEYEIEVGGGCNKEKKRTELVFYDDKNPLKTLPSLGATAIQNEIMNDYNDEKKNTVELIITESDFTALQVLIALQAGGFNTDKLTTHCIPVFTVGFDVDYKAFVLAGKPEDEDAAKDYLENSKYLCDLTIVEEEDVEAMIWNTKNVIGSGRLAGTVIDDQDTIAVAIATIVRNYIKGNDVFENLNAEYISDKTYLIPCITN